MGDSQQQNVVETTIRKVSYGHSGRGEAPNIGTVFLVVFQGIGRISSKKLVKYSDLTVDFVKRFKANHL